MPSYSTQSDAETSSATLIRLCDRWAKFWPNSAGWGPTEVTDFLTHSLMQRQVALAQSLAKWPHQLNNETNDGDLILAWVNLAAILEGALKVYFCVYYMDWINDPKVPKEKGVTRNPSNTFFEKLIIFSEQKSLFQKTDISLFRLIRDQRNIIHPLKDGIVLGILDYQHALIRVVSTCADIESRLPYPE